MNHYWINAFNSQITFLNTKHFFYLIPKRSMFKNKKMTPWSRIWQSFQDSEDSLSFCKTFAHEGWKSERGQCNPISRHCSLKMICPSRRSKKFYTRMATHFLSGRRQLWSTISVLPMQIQSNKNNILCPMHTSGMKGQYLCFAFHSLFFS